MTCFLFRCEEVCVILLLFFCCFGAAGEIDCVETLRSKKTTTSSALGTGGVQTDTLHAGGGLIGLLVIVLVYGAILMQFKVYIGN